VDDRNSAALGVCERMELCKLPVDKKISVVRAVRINPGEQLDQRRFARAVFAAEPMDFASAQIEVDVLERGYAGKVLGDVLRLQDDRIHPRLLMRNQRECCASGRLR